MFAAGIPGLTPPPTERINGPPFAASTTARADAAGAPHAVGADRGACRASLQGHGGGKGKQGGACEQQ